MRKFIHSDFEIDLSNLKITDNAENPWFTGTFFSKYSYPFDIPLTEENDRLFGFLSHYQSANAETLFEGFYVHGNTMEKAILEIEECEKVLSATMRYGLDDFPNFDKKLSELPLAKFEVDDIYQHAVGLLGLGWPEVNYNFPQVHIDKIDTENDVWFAFEKIINNFKDGAFLENYVDLVEEITYNKNIMQPLPYLLYVLQVGFGMSGYVMKGDILTDPDYKTALVYADAEYYTTVEQESQELFIAIEDHDSLEMIYPEDNIQKYKVSRQVALTSPGKYRITGRIFTWGINDHPIYAKIYYRNILLGSKVLADGERPNSFNPSGRPILLPLNWNVNMVFETMADLNPNFIRVEVTGRYLQQSNICELNINPIRLHDNSGNAIATIINKNQVDITRAVPDMTFGDFVKAVLQFKNLEITKRDNEMWINYVKKEMQVRPIIDLSGKEVRFPKIKYSKGHSYLLKYNDVSSEDYKYEEVFQNINGISMADFKTDDKTTEIAINALPLPLMLRNNVQTAHGFLTDKSKLMLVVYDGLSGGLNLARANDAWLLPKLHEDHYREWIQSNLLSQTFSWTFLAYYEDLLELNEKSRVHAYRKIHLIKSIQKTEIARDLFEVEVETKVLE